LFDLGIGAGLGILIGAFFKPVSLLGARWATSHLDMSRRLGFWQLMIVNLSGILLSGALLLLPLVFSGLANDWNRFLAGWSLGVGVGVLSYLLWARRKRS